MTDPEFLASPDIQSLRPGVRGSLLLEAESLARGMTTTRVGSRTFVAGTAQSPHLVGFNGALSQETSRAADRVAENRLMRKRHLVDHQIPVPESRTFSFDEIDEAISFGSQLPNGALVKPLLRGAGRVTLKSSTTDDALREEITRWNTTVPRGTRFLVEQRATGQQHQFILIGGRVVSVARIRGRRWEGEIARPGLSGELIHPSLISLAERTLTAQPRAAHGVVHIMSGDPTRSTRRAVVVSSSPRITLIGGRRPPEWSEFIARKMVDHAARDAPQPGDLGRPEDPAQRRTAGLPARVTLTGLRAPRETVETMTRWFAGQGAALTTDGISDAEATGWVEAPPELLAGFSGLAVTRGFMDERPQTVTIQQRGADR
ncbi:hypothetical protein [Nesterenkonia suensis]